MSAEYDDEASVAAELVREYDASELTISSEFLTNWLPFLSCGLCSACSSVIRHHVLSLGDRNEDPPTPRLIPNEAEAPAPDTNVEDHSESMLTVVYKDTKPIIGDDEETAPGSIATSIVPPVESPMARISWADMAQEDQLAEEEVERGRALDPCLSAVKGGEEATEKEMELTRERREMINQDKSMVISSYEINQDKPGKVMIIIFGLH